MTTKLPIDVVSGDPPVFRWQQLVSTPNGDCRIDHTSTVSPAIEGALVALVALVKQQAQEIIGMQRQIEGHAERIAAQSELLSKRAEVSPKKGK